MAIITSVACFAQLNVAGNGAGVAAVEKHESCKESHGYGSRHFWLKPAEHTKICNAVSKVYLSEDTISQQEILLQDAAKKYPLKFFAVFSATVRHFNLKFYHFIY